MKIIEKNDTVSVSIFKVTQIILRLSISGCFLLTQAKLDKEKCKDHTVRIMCDATCVLLSHLQLLGHMREELTFPHSECCHTFPLDFLNGNS